MYAMKLFVALFTPIFVLLSLLFSPTFIHAGTENNMIGWAWSDDIGWISFNCTNDNSCGTVDYGVTENTNGTLVGYAWSPEVGWIQFGGLSGFPTGSGTTAANATVSGGNLTGWAKAISADGNGWDGWISLAGSSPTYGVTLSGNAFVGYAWAGGDVGWISFNAASGVSGSCGVAYCGGVALSSSANLDAQAPLGTSIAGNGNVPYGTVANLVYTLNNISGDTCSLSKTSSGGTAFTTVTGITSSGSAATQGLTTGAYTFNVNCLSGSNSVASSSVSFTIGAQPPGFSLGSNQNLPISFLPAGWSQSKTVTIPIGAVGGFTGNVAVSISQYPTMPNASTTALYSINGGAWTASPSATVAYNGTFTFRVEVSAPLTTSYCSGGSNPCTIVLQGTSSGVSSATMTLTIQPNTFNPQFQEY